MGSSLIPPSIRPFINRWMKDGLVDWFFFSPLQQAAARPHRNVSTIPWLSALLAFSNSARITYECHLHTHTTLQYIAVLYSISFLISAARLGSSLDCGAPDRPSTGSHWLPSCRVTQPAWPFRNVTAQGQQSAARSPDAVAVAASATRILVLIGHQTGPAAGDAARWDGCTLPSTCAVLHSTTYGYTHCLSCQPAWHAWPVNDKGAEDCTVESFARDQGIDFFNIVW